jgi:regulator-associated protein of mTOR
MRDPNFDMEQNQNGSNYPDPAPAPNGTRRNQHKSARVTFGPDPDSFSAARDRESSPTPLASHHRSATTIESQLSPPTSRPNSSSNGDTTFQQRQDVMPLRPRPGSRPSLQRAKSDYGPRSGLERSHQGDDDDFAMRHGWQEEYTSSEYLKILHSVCRRNPPFGHQTAYLK